MKLYWSIIITINVFTLLWIFHTTSNFYGWKRGFEEGKNYCISDTPITTKETP